MEYSDQSDGAAIPLINPTTKRRLRVVANALSDDAGASFPLVRGVFRMTVLENYTANFGFQWNKFTRTQIDTAGQSTQSRDRFFAATGWQRADLNGAVVLEVGSGVGRPRSPSVPSERLASRPTPCARVF